MFNILSVLLFHSRKCPTYSNFHCNICFISLRKIEIVMPRFSWCKLSVAFRKCKPRKSVKREGGGGGLI